MSFDDVRFPPQISRGSSGGPERRTEIVVTGSGATAAGLTHGGATTRASA